MADSTSNLNTRWSMLDQLQGPARDEAWSWFVTTYSQFVEDQLRKQLSGERLDRALGDFWGYLMASGVFTNASREKRFRAYLFGTLRHYVRDFLRRDRGTGSRSVPTQNVEDLTIHDPGVDGDEPSQEETTAYFIAMLEAAVVQLENNPRLKRQAQALRGFYGIGQECSAPSEIRSTLGVPSDEAWHTLMHRARENLRAALVEVTSHTVAEQSALEDEVALLLQALGATKEFAGLAN